MLVVEQIKLHGRHGQRRITETEHIGQHKGIGRRISPGIVVENDAYFVRPLLQPHETVRPLRQFVPAISVQVADIAPIRFSAAVPTFRIAPVKPDDRQLRMGRVQWIVVSSTWRSTP